MEARAVRSERQDGRIESEMGWVDANSITDLWDSGRKTSHENHALMAARRAAGEVQAPGGAEVAALSPPRTGRRRPEIRGVRVGIGGGVVETQLGWVDERGITRFLEPGEQPPEFIDAPDLVEASVVAAARAASDGAGFDEERAFSYR